MHRYKEDYALMRMLGIKAYRQNHPLCFFGRIRSSLGGISDIGNDILYSVAGFPGLISQRRKKRKRAMKR